MSRAGPTAPPFTTGGTVESWDAQSPDPTVPFCTGGAMTERHEGTELHLTNEGVTEVAHFELLKNVPSSKNGVSWRARCASGARSNGGR
jgi:hypothetical protein